MSQNELDKVLKAPEQQLRAILRAVCDDEDARKKAIKHYHALQEFVPIYTSTESAKRKAKSEVHICVQCDEPFLEEDNRFGDCYYHPEHLVPDYDSHVWADHDERCHGTIDSDWCRKEYPDGHMWACCDRTGPDSEGCVKGKHEADPKRSKKGSGDYPEDQEGEDDDEDEDEDESDSEDYEDVE